MHALRADRDIEGLRAADSVSWDPHKSIRVNYPAGLLLLKSAGTLANLANPTSYALSSDCQSIDPGYWHFEGSRPLSAIKIWLTIATEGLIGIRRRIDSLHELADEVYAYLSSDRLFVPLERPETSIVCFSVRDRSLRSHLDHRRVRSELFHRGLPYFSTAEIDGEEWFRMVLSNDQTSFDHVLDMLGELRRVITSDVGNGEKCHAKR